MSTAVTYFATRESTIPAIRWTGSDASSKEIKGWCGRDVQVHDDKLLFQSDGKVETLPVGNYLVCVNGALFSFTPEELHEDYIRVQG